LLDYDVARQVNSKRTGGDGPLGRPADSGRRIAANIANLLGLLSSVELFGLL
jgi:hypothetical protein